MQLERHPERVLLGCKLDAVLDVGHFLAKGTDAGKPARRRFHELGKLGTEQLRLGIGKATEVARAIREGIARLNSEQRLVMCMKLIEGCSFAEIARVIDTTEAAAKMRFRRGLCALRSDLALQGIEP